MTTFGDRGHDHLRDDPPLSTADMAQAGGRARADAAPAGGQAQADAAQADTAQAHAASSPPDAPARTAQPGPESVPDGRAGTDPGPGPAPGSYSPAPSSAGAPSTAGGPSAAGAPSAATATADADGRTPLFADELSSRFRSRWTDVQAGFVDEPRSAVEQADGLVAEVMQQLATSFADERTRLEAEWERQGDVSTEDLRQALRRYRSFFDRLLTL
jgi:hypothetical protein